MTIIADQPPPEPPARHKQQLAAATLAHLLTLPLPEVWEWRIRVGREAPLFGQLPPTSLDVLRVWLHQWAAALTDPTWRIVPFDDGSGRLSVRGLFFGTVVEVWDGITAEQVVMGVDALSELDEAVSV
ncbi:hypothetical protein [Nonomuraea sp. NPDC049709]|uniref:hypothetical protein n=1 Tax=Nonomuraea sp. NPDC049709 TaxID=3154736 RepID=UPI00344391CB